MLLRRLIAALAALVLLTVLLVFQHVLKKRRDDTRFQEHQQPLLGEIAWDQVRSIELELPGEFVRLKNKNGVWVLPEHDDYPANKVYVNALLDVLKKTPRGNEVSRDVDKHPQFHLDAKARVVVLKDVQEKELGRMYVGKPDASYRATYVRLLDDPAVHYVTADLVPMLSRATWADRTVWRVPPREINKIVISDRRDDTVVSWSRENSDQPLTGVQNQPLTDDTLNALAHIQAADVLFRAKGAESMRPLYEIDLHVAGVTMELQLYHDEAATILATRKGSRVLFEIQPETLEIFSKLVKAN